MLTIKIKQSLIILLTWLLLSQLSMAASAPNLVSQIRLSPATPNILKFGQNVTVGFKYDTTEAAGVRIFARPFSGAALTPNYAACPSPLYPFGSGSGTCTFTISSGNATVDRIRFQIWDAGVTKVLYTIFVPVNYQFR